MSVPVSKLSGGQPREVLLIGSDGTAISATNPLPIGGTAGASLSNKSGSITSGGTAQTLAAANSSRRGFWVQNQSSGDLWINTLATAVADQPSLRIPAGSLYESPTGASPVGAISIIGATTGQKFAAREW